MESNPVGRPKEYMEDGLYDISQVKDVIKPCFTSEKDMCGFIERNIVDFTTELGYIYKSHIKEFPLQGIRKQVKGQKRIDFVIKTLCDKSIAIECKHPKYISELSYGIGQILSYITIGNHHGISFDSVYLVSSKMDYVIPIMLTEFNLPIKFMVMDKTKSLTWQRQ